MSVTHELADALITRLKADAAVVSFVGTKVFDRTRTDLTPPYVSLGSSDDSTDDAECIDAVEIVQQVNAWSWGANQAFSRAEVRQLSDAIRKALHEQELTLPTGALVSLRHRSTRILTAPDGLTHQAAATFVALIEIN
jgi:hypothetical protein